MASGKPIVASNISGYATVVKNGIDGLLTTPRNSEELAWAIGHLLGHELLRQQIIHASLHKARQYAWSRVAESIMEFYFELLDERNRGLLRQKSRAQ
jgi:phosphatidylinositol alpha-mannosyltransferase